MFPCEMFSPWKNKFIGQNLTFFFRRPDGGILVWMREKKPMNGRRNRRSLAAIFPDENDAEINEKKTLNGRFLISIATWSMRDLWLGPVNDLFVSPYWHAATVGHFSPKMPRKSFPNSFPFDSFNVETAHARSSARGQMMPSPCGQFGYW